ncbi:FUSC family protein [Streptomyces sp. NPDC048297]|uniref:FUSC family protein n=1 Tax=Streptomyces sp. NPDC048297 TaxID=3365531 RepID=UPI00372321D0
MADLTIGRPTMAIFAAISPIVLTMFVNFSGRMRERMTSQSTLVVVSTILICLGSLTDQFVWLAVAATFLASFLILFLGVISSMLAGATTSLLISFVLPATFTGSVSSIPDRVVGWSMGGAATVVATAVLWPAPNSEPLRTSVTRACTLLARRLRVEVDCIGSWFSPVHTDALNAAIQDATTGVADLRNSFFSTPHRPTGLSTESRALVRLVDQVIWLDEVLEQVPPRNQRPLSEGVVCEVKLAAAELLECGAALLVSSTTAPQSLVVHIDRLERARAALEETMTTVLPESLTPKPAQALSRSASLSTPEPMNHLLRALAPSFRAQEMSFAVSAIAANIHLSASAQRRTWWQRLIGYRPAGSKSVLSSARERSRAHLNSNSVWLRNSVRGAVALSLAVLLAHASGLQHSFWIAFGVLSVLRSNALNTGQTIARALLGNVIGLVVGVALILALSPHPTGLWLLLPVAIAIMGLESAVTSLTAGQVGFTVVLLILFTIIAPAGWKIGLVRIEDVALGCAVSLVVGVLFWPRGATAALGQVLGEALGASAQYVRSAVAFGLTRCDSLAVPSPAPDGDRQRAADSARRLDDAFRSYLAERGTKRLVLADVTALVNAVVTLRITADAIDDLWSHSSHVPRGDRAAARAEILVASAPVIAWFERAGRAISGAQPAPGEVVQRMVAGKALQEAVRCDLAGDAVSGTAAAVRMVWTAKYMDSLRRLQADIADPTRAAASAGGRRLLRKGNFKESGPKQG